MNPAGSGQGNPFTCAQSCAVFSSAVGGWSLLDQQGQRRAQGARVLGYRLGQGLSRQGLIERGVVETLGSFKVVGPGS